MQDNLENADRALAATAALTEYKRAKDNADRAWWIPGPDEDKDLTDLLTDLRHYCALNGEDFEKHMSRSAAHFNAETEE